MEEAVEKDRLDSIKDLDGGRGSHDYLSSPIQG
jgi:hypothetical protein